MDHASLSATPCREICGAELSQSAEDQVGPPDEDTTGRDEYFGFGRVNLDAALRLAASLQ